MATPTIHWYYWDGDSWEDISAYVLVKGGCNGSWGMASNKHNDRLARTGEMRIVLDNTGGIFDPDDADVLTGWKINAKIKLEVTFDGTTWRRFYGSVQSVKFSDPNTHEHTASVTIADWMRYAYKFPLTNLAVESRKRGIDAISSVVNNVGQAPLATKYSQGDYIYDVLFDSVTVNTKAATELNKIVLSEFGYCYNRHDKINGETITFEAGSDRGLSRSVAKIPKMVSDCGFVLQAGSATDFVLDCAGNKIIINETQDAHIDGFGDGFTRTYGENILNNITVTAYPKRTDSTEQTLYSLGSALRLSDGETKTIKAKYQNLSTKESCNAITSLMIQPVATTDYTMNKKSDGSGTNTTANLTVVANYKSAEVELTLTNKSGFEGYVTMLKCRGYGIYQDSSIRAQAENSASQLDYSDFPMNIEQQYQRDTVAGESTAWKLLYEEKEPNTKLERVSMIANKSDTRMLAFLAVDIGDMVKVTESDLGIDDYYYVQGIEFSIRAGNLIVFEWILKEVEDYTGLYTDISLDFNNTAGQSVVFNNLIADLPQQTIMFRYNMTSFGDTGISQYIVNRIPAWYIALLTSSERIDFAAYHSSVVGVWAMDNNSFDAGLHHVAITYNGVLTTNDPVMYLDGASEHINELATPSGNRTSGEGVALSIGSLTAGKSPNGNVYDVRIFNRILSSVEIAAEYATPGTVTDGLIFKSPSVYTIQLSDYDNLTLTSSTKIFDSVDGIIGTAYGSPVSQIP